MKPDDILSEGWVNTPEDLATKLGDDFKPPTGVTVGAGNGEYYAFVRTQRNGQRVIQWFKRGSGGGPVGEDGKPGDAVTQTQTVVVPGIAARWAEQGAKEADKPPTTRVINGVLHQVTGKDANGQDIWSPVQTAAGPATASTTTTKPVGSTTKIEGTPLPNGGFDNERPVMVTRGPDGKLISSEPLTPAEETAWRQGRQRSRNPGGKTDAEIDAERKDAQATATAASVERRATSQEARLAEEAKRPDTKVERRTVNGVDYIVSVTTPKDGSAPTVRYFGPDGQAVPRLPSEGEASVGGPPMPTIVLGASEEAARAYNEALWKDPTLTPAQREKRFAEFMQVATLAVQEAATAQRERESQRNAEYNTASTKLNYLQSGMGQALDFVSKFNGFLPEGSTLGGEAFAALLGLQMIQMQQSGINSITPAGTSANPPGQKPPAAPVITSADLVDPAKLAAKRAEVMAHPVFRPAAPVTAADPVATPDGVAPAGAAPLAPQPAATGAPASAVPPVSQLPEATPGGGPPAPTDAPGFTGAPSQPAAGLEAPDDVLTIRDPRSGATVQMTRANWDQSPPESRAAFEVVNAENGAAFRQQHPSVSQATSWDEVPGTVPGAVPPMKQDAPPDYGAPGMRVLPQPGTPAQPVPLPPGEVTRAPASAFPALAAFQPAPATPAPVQPVMTPAVLAMRAQTTPGWRLRDDEVQAMLDAGVPEDVIFGAPRMSA